jgi:hypothetical protein
MDGSYAICSSTTSKKRYIRFDNFGKAPTNTYLTIKCCVYKGDHTADLIIRGNNDEVLYEQPLVLDEQFYTFAIPEGTTTISLIQKEIGTKAKGYHRISLQQAYLYSGDYKVTIQHLEGSPFTLSTTLYHLTHSQNKDQSIYYRITPLGLRTSNTVSVVYNPTTDVTDIPTYPTKAKKIIQDGKLYLLQDNKIYTILGQIYEK